MKKGQAVFIVILILIIIVIIFVMISYFSQTPITGKAIDENQVEEKEEPRQNLFNNIETPESIQMVAEIEENNRESFEVRNLNDQIIRMSCSFPDFQAFVPASSCFTFDRDGNFVSSENNVRILPGQKQTFTVSVFPFDDLEIRKNDTVTKVTIQEGEYNRYVILRAWLEEGHRGESDELRIPIKVFVED